MWDVHPFPVIMEIRLPQRRCNAVVKTKKPKNDTDTESNFLSVSFSGGWKVVSIVLCGSDGIVQFESMCVQVRGRKSRRTCLVLAEI
jgi:hypothetical protein